MGIGMEQTHVLRLVGDIIEAMGFLVYETRNKVKDIRKLTVAPIHSLKQWGKVSLS